MISVVSKSPAVSGEDSITRSVLAIARELATELHPGMSRIPALGSDSSIERDFGLDSLARVELGLRIERATGIAIPETAFEESETIRDLARALLRGRPAVPAVPAHRPRIAIERAAVSAAASPATLIDALEWRAREQGQRTHILLADREAEPTPVSFSDLRRMAMSVAAGLRRCAVQPGDTVAIMVPTGADFFAAFYGVLYARAVPVPLYPPARPSQIEIHLRRLAGILANCEARVLLTFDPGRRLAILLRSMGIGLTTVASVAEIAAPQSTPLEIPAATPGDTAFLQYTSGSTGRPKGVVLTHSNLMANLDAMQRATGVASTDCFVSWLPLYHDMGLIGAALGALVMGFPLVLLSPIVFLSHPARWLHAIARHRATITAAPNFAYELCLGKIADGDLAGLDLGSLRMAFNGAEAVSPRTVERFAERFARCGLRREVLMPVYGLAECALGLTFPPVGRGPLIHSISRPSFLRSGMATSAPATETSPLRFVSCGAPLPGHSVRIVDARRGTELPEGAQGRIEFKGPSATAGYFHNPVETARLFHGEWLDTGDLGYLADGEIYVTGRARDIIIRGGHNIHPQELEEAAALLPGVRKGGVAVFPATDPHSGTERIVVVAETREERRAARDELIASINRLAVDLIGLPVDEVVLARPRTVLKTSSGKTRRSACRDAYERGELGATARPVWLQLTRLAGRALLMQSAVAGRRVMRLAWGLRVWIVGVLFTPLFWLRVVLTPGLARRRRAAAAVARCGLRLCGVSIRVRESKEMTRAPRVFVANHASYLDGVLLLIVLPPEVAFVAKQELARSFFIGRLLERLGCVFVERCVAHEAATGARALQEHLRAGESIVVFAEGTFRRDPGLLPFHMGAFCAAAAGRAVVVPVAIRGTRGMLPEGTTLPRPAHIEIVMGEPLTPDDSSWHAAVTLRRRARQHILAQVHEPDLEELFASASP